MKISTKGRYALRIIIDLAQNGGTENFISLKEISERQGISLKYLENIVGILNKSNFLISLRGKNGGYKLSKSPDNYTVGSILKLTEGNLAPVTCLECVPNDCSKAEKCITLPMWKGLYTVIDDYLENITIQDLISM